MTFAVVGAGVMGLSVAHALMARKHDVHVFDSGGFPAKNASFIAGGMLAPLSEIEHLPPEYIAAARHSVELWRGLLDRLGRAELIQQHGSLMIAHDDDRHMLARFEDKLQVLAGWEKMDARGISEIAPDLSLRFRSGIFLSKEAHIDPAQAMDVLCSALETTIPGEMPVLNQNDYEVIIDCRGMGAIQEDNQLRGVKGETVVLRNPDFSLKCPVRLMHPRYPLYIVPRADHIFMLGATLIEGHGDHHVGVRSALELLSAAYSLHPSFADASIVDIRAGVRPAYPDNLPRMVVRNKVISCNGLFRHGRLLAPVMAECLADMIDQKANVFERLFLK